MYGYMGKLLRVNLTEGKVTEEAIDPAIANDYIGGGGYATKLLFDEVPGSTDPLSPSNKLIFMTGPLTGTVFPTACRYEVVAKSPLTGTWGDASSGGEWATPFKKTGYDGIVFEGRSPKPVYLSVTNDNAELKDASHLWGQDSFEVQESIRKELGDDRVKVACIGPAGEKQVLFSCVMNDDGRAAGRGGMGAVMGSKNLKAVAVRGTKRVSVADSEQLKVIAKAISDASAQYMVSLTIHGTAGSLDTGWVMGDVPVKNWQVGPSEEWSHKLGGKTMAETILKPHKACTSCPIKCARWIKINSGKYAMEGPGPEYEALCSFGTMCMVDDMEACCWVNHLANRYGLDVISAGVAVAFAMECYEKGIITKADTGGIDLKWGNAEAMIEVTRLIGERSGIGELLGQGVKRAAAKLGKGSEAFAVQVKGMEAPMHDPRAFFSMAVHYATNTRGADHMRGMAWAYELGFEAPDYGIAGPQDRHALSGKGHLARVAQDQSQLHGSMVVCNFAGNFVDSATKGLILGLATGQPYSADEIKLIGERIFNLTHLFNLGCGLTAADNTLPARLLKPASDSEGKHAVPNLAEQLTEYYNLRGWNAQARPTLAKLSELGLEAAAAKIQGMAIR